MALYSPTGQKKRRALYSDMLDGEAEKSGSDHSDDEYEGMCQYSQYI